MIDPKKNPNLPPRGILPEPANLPPSSRMAFLRNANFVGRKNELLNIANLLFNEKRGAKDPCYPIIISGIIGVGKTQMAIEFCYRYGRFLKGVYWIRADQRDIWLQIAECGIQMGITPWPEGLEERVNLTVKTWQIEKDRLIILDNPGNLYHDEWFKKLLKCSLIITSRCNKILSNIRFDEIEVGTMNERDSRSLFRILTPRLESEEDNTLDLLSKKLGFLPMALNHAGSFLNYEPTLSVNDLLEEIDSRSKGDSYTALATWQRELSPTDLVSNILASYEIVFDKIADLDDAQINNILITCGYCEPNVPIRISFINNLYPCYEEEKIGSAINLFIRLGFLQKSPGGSYMHPLISEYLITKDKYQAITKFILGNLYNSLSSQIGKSEFRQISTNYPHIRSLIYRNRNLDPLLSRKFYYLLGVFSFIHADYSDAYDYFSIVGDISREISGKEDNYYLLRLAHVFIKLDLFDDAISLINYVESENIGLSHQYDYSTGYKFLLLAEAEFGLCLWNEAYKHIQKANRIYNLDLPPDNEIRTQILITYSKILLRLGDSLNAQKKLNSILAKEDRSNIYPNLIAEALNLLGEIEYKAENISSSKKYLRKALRIVSDTFGEGNLHSTKININLAKISLKTNDLSGAQNYLENALRIFRDFRYTDFLDYYLALSILADIYRRTSNFDESKEIFDNISSKIHKKQFSKHPVVGSILIKYAILLKEINDFQEAKIKLLEAKNILLRYYPGNNKELILISKILGQLDSD